jgi:hypothetical protein
MHDALPPLLRDWVIRQADAMGLPGPDDFIVLQLRLERQRQALATVHERYRRLFTLRPAA